ncbi:MAG: hypothetical protein K2X93_00085 [Candidatus Obscuribacterales bacterium]|nr:hypothetical protein [Candidatus Obscuribacterales bacterium]
MISIKRKGERPMTYLDKLHDACVDRGFTKYEHKEVAAVLSLVRYVLWCLDYSNSIHRTPLQREDMASQLILETYMRTSEICPSVVQEEAQRISVHTPLIEVIQKGINEATVYSMVSKMVAQYSRVCLGTRLSGEDARALAKRLIESYQSKLRKHG